MPALGRDASGTLQSWLKADLVTPGASQRRPGDVQNRVQDGPETLPDGFRVLCKRVLRIKYRRTRLPDNFSMFLFYCANARSSKFVRPRSVS